MIGIDWSSWPVLEVRVAAPQPTCYARPVIEALRAGLHRGGPFAVVVVGEPTAAPRPRPVLGPIDTRWLRHCRGPLTRNCRGIAYVCGEASSVAALLGCASTSFVDVDAARHWARARVTDGQPRVAADV